jgi:hypothetical protein
LVPIGVDRLDEEAGLSCSARIGAPHSKASDESAEALKPCVTIMTKRDVSA